MVNIQNYLTELEESDQIDIKDYLEIELSQTQRKFGLSPTTKIVENLIESGNITTLKDLEYFFFIYLGNRTIPRKGTTKLL